ncbi:nuclear transport factor 2 family protein [Nocardia suismassiliense]|uniref:Nuclear transport factor 2 family protein n=1 Tax=Nocardia suismassiliense TaxID=2077092 RepID=A0ABW6R889_9NOCA
MSTSDKNKQLMKELFAGLAQGDGTRMNELLAEDCRWTVIGTTPLSGTNIGKEAIDNAVTAHLLGRLDGPIICIADRFIAEDDHVVIQFHGQATTTQGRPYNNTYCWVCRLSDGQIREVTEYVDTQLVMTTLLA